MKKFFKFCYRFGFNFYMRMFLPFVGFIFLSSATFAQQSGDFTYTVSEGTVTITGYTCPGGAAVIPDTINDLPVVGIGNNSFQDCTGLTSVTIPNSIKSIGAAAFYGCSGLTSVTIPNSVMSIGVSAFRLCNGLTSVIIPVNVASIGYGPFADCSSLTSIVVDASNTVYSSQDGVLYDKAVTVLIQYPAGKSGGFSIPNSVTSIGDSAFNGCTALSSVIIPDSVTSIGEQAFRNCISLTSVTIPSKVTIIGGGAFVNCTGLTIVTIGNSVTIIGYSAFNWCFGLTKAYFLGNAPFWMGAVFDHCASTFAVCYTAGATGFTNPWYGYPAAVCDGTTTTTTTTTTSFSPLYKGLLHPPLLRFSRPVAINNRGDVIGVWFNWANNSAYRTEISFLYRRGIYTKLLPRGWKRAAAWYINDNGEVAGNGYNDDTTNVKGFLYSKGRYTKLLPPGWDWATTNGLNDNSEVVGFGKDGDTIKLFLYSAGQYTEFLPPGRLGGFQFEKLFDINNSGAVVGTTRYGDNTRGFIYKDGAYTELLPPGRVNASALHIADNGTVLIQSGTGPVADVPDKYFIYKDGEYIELLPPGCSYVRPPIDCSDSGAIIGQGIDDNYHYRKFFYKDGAYTALSAIGMEPAQAVMNDNGVVFGWGFDSTQTDKWFFFNGKDYTVKSPPPALNNIDQADYYSSEGGKQRFYSIVGINNSEQIIGVVKAIYYIPMPAPWMPDWVITLKQRSFIASLH